MRIRQMAPAVLAAAGLVAAACSTSGGSGSSANSSKPAVSAPASGSPAAGSPLKTTNIHGVVVLTNSKGFTLYWFAPDTPSASRCNGTCAQVWPPVKGPATAGSGVTGKLSVIKRSDGTMQATYNGHPLYTYTADTAPGQANGNGINASGGVWHDVAVTGTSAPAPSHSPTSGGGGGHGY